jgi:hypothetical protein
MPVSPVARLGSLWRGLSSLGVHSRSWGLHPGRLLQYSKAVRCSAQCHSAVLLRPRCVAPRPVCPALSPRSFSLDEYIRRRRASNAVQTRIRYSYHFFSKILTPRLVCPAAEDNRFAGSLLIPKKSLARAVKATDQQVTDQQRTLLCAARGRSFGSYRTVKEWAIALRHAMQWRFAPWGCPSCMGMQGTKTNPCVEDCIEPAPCHRGLTRPMPILLRGTVAENLCSPRPAMPNPGRLCYQHSEYGHVLCR